MSIDHINLRMRPSLEDFTLSIKALETTGPVMNHDGIAGCTFPGPSGQIQSDGSLRNGGNLRL